MKDQRVGRFTIARRQIEREQDALKHLFAKMIVIRAESLFHVDSIEYMAISDLFDLCAPFQEPMKYGLKIDMTKPEPEVTVQDWAMGCLYIAKQEPLIFEAKLQQQLYDMEALRSEPVFGPKKEARPRDPAFRFQRK